MILKTLAEGFVLGLSTGVTCLVTCAPIYLPYLISEKRGPWQQLWKVTEISLGRFISYALFGAAAGWVGGNLASIDRTLFTGIAYLLLSVFLLLSLIRVHKEDKRCALPFWLKFSKSAFLLGVLTGINFCPSFLIAVSNAIELGGALSGTILFVGFFGGTTIFLIPLAFAGMLSWVKEVKVLARWASVLIAIWFIGKGGLNIYHYWQHYQQGPGTTEGRIVDPIDSKTRLVLWVSPKNRTQAKVLSDSLLVLKKEQYQFRVVSDLPVDSLQQIKDAIYLVDSDLWNKKIDSLLVRKDVFIIPVSYPEDAVLQFLRGYSIKVSPEKGARWVFRAEKESKRVE